MIWSPLLDTEFERVEASLERVPPSYRLASAVFAAREGGARIWMKLAPLGDLPATVIGSDEVICRVCGEPTRTCECEA